MTKLSFAFPGNFPRQSVGWDPFPSSLGSGIAISNTQTLPHLLPDLYAGLAPDPLFVAIKGRLTEAAMTTGAIRELLAGTGGWVPMTPRLAPQGIDGLFIKVDALGHPHGLLIAEAKFGSSQLGRTLTGRQMGADWIQVRLSRLARDYQQLAEHLQGPCQFERFVPPKVRSLVVPLAGKRTATIWLDPDGVPRVYTRHPVSIQNLKDQLQVLGRHLAAGAEGEIPYRARLFRLSTDQSNFVIESHTLDRGGYKVRGGLGEGRVIRGRFGAFSPKLQQNLRAVFERDFLARGFPEPEARELARRASEDANFLQRMRKTPVYSWRAGMDSGLFKSAVGAALLAAAFEAFNFVRTGYVDWKSTGANVALVGLSGSFGYLGAAQFQALLVGTEIGRNLLSCVPATIAGQSSANFLGSVAGGVVASMFFLVGLRAIGLTDNRQLSRAALNNLSGLAAGSLAAAGTMATVMTFGTASTGTAIASLSGAAATNASLAILGGGTLASGGGGMALGATVLSGGAALIAVGAATALHLVFKHLDDKEQRRLIIGRMDIVTAKMSA